MADPDTPDYVAAGVLILLVCIFVHWLGQALSVLSQVLATWFGLRDKEALPDYKVDEHVIAAALAVTSIVRLYSFARAGLLLDASWGYKLA